MSSRSVGQRMWPVDPEEREAGNFITLGLSLPDTQGEPRVHAVAQTQVGSHGQNLCHTTIESHLGSPNKYLGSTTGQFQVSRYPLM